MLKRTRISVAIGAAFGIGLAGLAPSAMAQQQLDRVEITGSSIKRIEGETALPVQVITREDIQRTGASNVEQLMQTVSAAASSGNIVAASASGATTLGLSGISLRGLSSLRTLVLINGKRVTPYGYGFTNDASSVDVNAIPLSAIERVEVLKDGASAVYGSDAIAGVVNFILRKDFQGLEIGAEYGTPSESSAGSKYRVWGTYGFGDLNKDRFNFMVTVSYQKEKALFGRDRDFASSGINVEALQRHDVGQHRSRRTSSRPTASFGDAQSVVPGLPWPVRDAQPAVRWRSQGCRFDPSPLGHPDCRRSSAPASLRSGRFRLTPDVELYGEASFAQERVAHVIQPTPISDQFTIPLNNPLANTFPYNAFTGGEPTVGGLPYSTILLVPRARSTRRRSCSRRPAVRRPTCWCGGALRRIGDRDLTDTSEASRLNFGARGVGRQLGLRRRLPVHEEQRRREPERRLRAVHAHHAAAQQRRDQLLRAADAGGSGGAQRDEVLRRLARDRDQHAEPVRQAVARHRADEGRRGGGGLRWRDPQGEVRDDAVVGAHHGRPDRLRRQLR